MAELTIERKRRYDAVASEVLGFEFVADGVRI
jgi:hypothetical protein